MAHWIAKRRGHAREEAAAARVDRVDGSHHGVLVLVRPRGLRSVTIGVPLSRAGTSLDRYAAGDRRSRHRSSRAP